MTVPLEKGSYAPTDGAADESGGGSNPSETDPLLKKPELCDLSCVDWFAGLQEHFGYKLLSLLFVVQHLMRGFVDNFTLQAQPYIYRSYHIPAPQMQIYQGITQLPWALKPVIGLMSDVVPIGGYNKGPYMLIASVLGALAFTAVGAYAGHGLTVGMLVIGLFLCSLQISLCDILTEAKYSEKIRASPSHGPSILTYVWFGMQVGGLIGILASGVVISQGEPRFAYLISALPALAVAAPVLLGYIEEEKQTAQESSAKRAMFYEQKEACFLCLLILAGIILLSATAMISGDPVVNAIMAILVGLVMLMFFTIMLSPVIARANCFGILQSALAWSTGGAGFYFFTDTPEQYPEGPHFSEFFYTSVVGTVGALLSLVGIATYKRYLSTWKYRRIFILTNLISALFSLLDLLIYTRWNLKIGIPDHAFMLSSTVMTNVISQWMWMPQVVMLAYLCPKGMEATMYALLAGCHNLGNTIGSSCGALMLHLLGCQPSGAKGESAQFEHLWIAALVATVLPTITTMVTVNLLPDARQNEKILADNAENDATAGSLWKRWTKAESVD